MGTSRHAAWGVALSSITELQKFCARKKRDARYPFPLDSTLPRDSSDYADDWSCRAKLLINSRADARRVARNIGRSCLDVAFANRKASGPNYSPTERKSTRHRSPFERSPVPIARAHRHCTRAVLRTSPENPSNLRLAGGARRIRNIGVARDFSEGKHTRVWAISRRNRLTSSRE